jgi:hypothetical protein
VDQVDDLVIFARVVEIDGPGGILGQAGPCYFRNTGSPLPFVGRMSFDIDDVAGLEANGIFDLVILHEMGHVIGFYDPLWDFLGLIADRTTTTGPINDTHFTGANAIAAFDVIGGASYPDAKVPLENDNVTYGVGSLNGHWRESEFSNELMTPSLGPTFVNPISVLTVESLRDIGYEVDPDAADPYTYPPPSPLMAEGGGLRIELGDDLLRGEIYFADRDGRLLPLGGGSEPADKDRN